jgi:uncharacterized phiE125 gp8 family phage protein
MSLTIVTPPEREGIGLLHAKTYLKITTVSTEDGVLCDLIAAVTDWVAGRNGWLGRSLITQTLELRVAGFPDTCEAIKLPRPPFQSIVSVKFLDCDGIEQTLPETTYSTFTADNGLTYLYRRPSQTWPATQGVPEAIRIRYVAGSDEIDPGLQHAILMTVARLFEKGGDGYGGMEDDPYIRRLFAPYRVYS